MRHQIQLKHEETDIDIVLPTGVVIELQYRLEAPSIDVVLPHETSITNWSGDDMEPAPKSFAMEHVRLAKQIVIDLDPEWVDEKR